MQAPLVIAFLTVFLATTQLGGVPDVLEVFQHDGCTWERVLDEALGEDVIVVSASPKLFARELLEVSLGASGAFGLQLSFQTEGTPFLFFPLLLAQELTSRSDSRPIQTQVNPDHFLGRNNSRLRDGDNDMEHVTPFAITQISTTHAIANIRLQVSRHREGQFNTPDYGGKATSERVPLDPVRTLVIANTGHLTVRTANRLEGRNGLALFSGFLNLLGVCLFFLDLPGQCRFDGFCGLDTGRTDQLCRKVRVVHSQGIVRAFVQLHAIATCCREPFTGDSVKASGMLLKGCLEYACLLWRRVQLRGNRSIHAECISYILTYCQAVVFDCPAQAPRKERLSSHRVNGDGYPGDLRYERRWPAGKAASINSGYTCIRS